MIKGLSLNNKSIRIRNDSKSNSKQKLKSLEKTQFKLQKANISQGISKDLRSQKTNPIVSILQKSKISPKQSRTLLFFPNKQKRLLTITNKQNLISNQINGQPMKNQTNSNSKQTPILSKKLSIIQILQQKESEEILKNELTQRFQINNQYKIQINYNKKGQNFQNKKNNKKAFKSSYIYEKQCQQCFSKRSLGSYKVQNQFSITIYKNIQTTDSQTQTISFGCQEKYQSQYAKYRKLKEKFFYGVQDRLQKINRILNNTTGVQQNYHQFIKSVSQSPIDDRQNRIFNLKKDLQNQKSSFEESLNKINNLTQSFEEFGENYIIEVLNKKSILMTSISHLVDSSLFLTKNQKIQNTQKLTRILTRVKNQVKYLQKFAVRTESYAIVTLKQYNSQIENFKKEHKSFAQSYLQAQVLLFNCFKKIEKISALSVMLFGFDDQPQICERFKGQQKIQCRFTQYMSAKCEECYHTRKKIKILQFNNEKIKPVLKSIKWLLEDTSKPSCCLSII